MKNLVYFLLASAILFSCKEKTSVIKPERASITESIYASGNLKSKNQYQAFANVNGVISTVYVSEGDTVQIGTPILSVSNQMQKLMKENAELNASYSDIQNNQAKINEAELFVEFSRNKMKIDSAMYFRQQSLWSQQVGTKADLEQRELAYENSKTNYYSSLTKYEELVRQLKFNASQTKKNLQISSQQESEYTLKSDIDGIVYSILKSKGEVVSLQTPLAVIGDASQFILEMQVDEYDIFKIQIGQTVLVNLDSYKDEIFEAKITKINPFMNERSKTFVIEAEFSRAPDRLYPNITFEANILLQTKENALLLPRNYVLNDTAVFLKDGKIVRVKTGLKDYNKIEILSGINDDAELILPQP